MQRRFHHFAIPSTIVWPVFLLVVLACSMPTFGQTEKQQEEIVCSLKTAYVTVRVELICKTGNSVADKRIRDFSIFEDGVEQEIDSLYAPKLTDTSGQRAVYYLGYNPADTVNERPRKIEVVLIGGESKRIWGLFSPASYTLKELDSLPGIREDERWKP